MVVQTFYKKWQHPFKNYKTIYNSQALVSACPSFSSIFTTKEQCYKMKNVNGIWRT